jgi:hypothetical protein
MRFAEVIGFIMGEPADFRAADARVRPGDRFGRYEQSAGWTYVEVSALNDGHLRPGCVYARAFSRRHPAGRDGYCYMSQLGLRIDDASWAMLRAGGWPAVGVALGIGADDTPTSHRLDG